MSSDPPFRALCKKYGADLMYTEFISSEGLIRDAAKSRAKLDIFEYERPIGIQIFGSEIGSMRQAAAITEEAQPDIVDINYGCPVKKSSMPWSGCRDSSGYPEDGVHDEGNCGHMHLAGDRKDPLGLG